ncbi:hypothetical protein TNCV_176971 [Trichonephila clavipes]|nr:hypothetical protein TNCV_176971 [Trichonephila clavipes]
MAAQQTTSVLITGKADKSILELGRFEEFGIERRQHKNTAVLSDRPEIWFYQVEAQFQISRISLEETKFHYLVSQLEPKYVENIWDIVNSKSDTKYTDSKNRLLSLFKESENLRIKRLLTGIELGDMKPSQLLQKLKTVATSDTSDNLIKTLWLEKLPESIKNILVVSDENLSKLVVMADKISDMTPRTEIFATGISLDCGEATSSRDQLLLDRIQSLEEQICQLSILHKSRTKERNSFHPKSRSRSRKRFDPKGKYCYFHSRFEDYKACRKFRLFVKDRTTNLHFLVDSGADCSIIPATSKNKQPSDYKLFAANGTEIPTYEIKVLNIDLGLRREFLFPFIIAKVSKGILGADFLNKFNLLIDIRNKQLIDGITNLHVTDLMKPNLLITNTKHDVKHYIATKGPPVYSKARQLDSKKLEIAKQEFKFMLDNDILRPSKSPWASPLHLVNKKDGSVRPCGDYRRLNAQTIPDSYPIPRIEDFHHILKGKRIFSKIDLFKAYFQIPIAEEDKEKTAIITPFGLFEFNVMSFGLRNAPSTFQRFINEVLFGLEFVFPYLDDILVASETEEEHKTHLKLVFDRLQKHGLRVNISKSTFWE